MVCLPTSICHFFLNWLTQNLYSFWCGFAWISAQSSCDTRNAVSKHSPREAYGLLNWELVMFIILVSPFSQQTQGKRKDFWHGWPDYDSKKHHDSDLNMFDSNLVAIDSLFQSPCINRAHPGSAEENKKQRFCQHEVVGGFQLARLTRRWG